MDPFYSEDGQAVVIALQAGTLTIPIARWPREAERLGLGTWEGETFTPETPAAALAVFQPLSRAQLRLGLLAAEITGDMVSSAIAAIVDDEDRETARILWEDAATYHRDHPLIDTLSAGFGLSSGTVDTLWHAAELL